LENKQEFEFEFTENFLEEFLLQLYSENPIPKEIILPENIDDSLKDYLENKKNSKLIITIPEKGEKKQLLDLVLKNIEISFFGEENKLEELKLVLNPQNTPRVIECFDISHLTGTSIAGSMVQFRNGKPDKTNYRKFKIRSVNQIDDFAAINEIVFRRYYRLKQEKSEFPGLIVIDGGKGQLNSAIEALNKLNLKLPIISIAKEFEEIYTPEASEPLKLDKKNKGLQLIQAIRDEAHRFAINYNKLLRKKKLFEKS
jgi:excinuclease ABC subunit C